MAPTAVVDQLDPFAALQGRLVGLWPSISAPSDDPKTIVVVPSLTLDLPPEVAPLVPAYEERFLFMVLLLKQPRANVVFVTSSGVPPRIVDYYLSLVPGTDAAGARSRLSLVTTADTSFGPLVRKVLDRPRTLERLRRLVPDPAVAHLVPYVTTDLEVELALRLGIPMYGANPDCSRLGTKAGARRIFAEEAIPHPAGVEDVAGEDDVVEAIERLRAARPALRRAMVKLNEGVGGFGNAIVDVEGVGDRDEIRARLRTMAHEDVGWSPREFFEALARQGGVVEEQVTGAEMESPSVQLRITPRGGVEVLSTHDQVLGGATGRSYVGCRFPARAAYAPAIASHARRVGERLAKEGVIGRFAIDFLAVRREADGGWDVQAIEINLRKGGTTHPFLTLQFLTDGTYDESTGSFTTPGGRRRCYVATDHLRRPGTRALTPDDLLDLVTESDLHWNPERQEGVVFHMISALPVVGHVGVTAIAESVREAGALYTRTGDRLEEWAATV